MSLLLFLCASGLPTTVCVDVTTHRTRSPPVSLPDLIT